MAERLKRLVSSDVVGFAGPKELARIYSFLPKPIRVELVGWDCGPFNGRVDSWLDRADAHWNDVEIIAIHGRTGGRGSPSLAGLLTVELANHFLIPTRFLLDYGGEMRYLLVHGEELKRDGVLGLIVNDKPDEPDKPKGACLMVENHPSEGGLDEAVTGVKNLRDRGVEAGLAFDIIHCLNALDESALAKKWEKMMREMDKLAGEIEVIHLPIGTLPGEGLPFADSGAREYVDKEMLKDLADVFFNLPELRYLVIENQWLVSAFVGLGGWAEKIIAKRTEKVFNEYLAPAGIV